MSYLREQNERAALTGRQVAMVRLTRAIAKSSAADLMRAADFLDWAYEVRRGCREQRRQARQRQGFP